MTTLTIKIDKDTPEIARVLEYLRTLSGVTITPGKSVHTKSESAWDKAISAGAISPKEFHTKLEEEIKNNW